MAEENKQERIEEIQEKISEELRDVERLEKEERELIKEEHEHHDHDHKHLVRVKVDNAVPRGTPRRLSGLRV